MHPASNGLVVFGMIAVTVGVVVAWILGYARAGGDRKSVV